MSWLLVTASRRYAVETMGVYYNVSTSASFCQFLNITLNAFPSNHCYLLRALMH